MSEETEKKQEFVVHKKQKDSAPATPAATGQAAAPEKKRIVVCICSGYRDGDVRVGMG